MTSAANDWLGLGFACFVVWRILGRENQQRYPKGRAVIVGTLAGGARTLPPLRLARGLRYKMFLAIGPPGWLVLALASVVVAALTAAVRRPPSALESRRRRLADIRARLAELEAEGAELEEIGEQLGELRGQLEELDVLGRLEELDQVAELERLTALEVGLSTVASRLELAASRASAAVEGYRIAGAGGA